MSRKKLTDICSIQYGFPFDSALFSSSPNDGMPLIRIRDVNNGYTSTYYKGEYLDEYVVHKGEYLIGMDGEFNIAIWRSDDALLNQRVCKISSKSEDVSTEYLYRFLKKELKVIENETPFVTVKHLSAKRLNQVYLVVPPIAEQERIVGELDLLSGIIDKQRAQLKELDTLAQSIFYSTFGDPITNEKGWEVKVLGDVCKLVNGFAFRSETFKSEGLPVLRISNIQNDVIREEDMAYFSPDDYDENFSKYEVHNGDIVIAMSGATTGKLGVHKGMRAYYLNQRVGKFSIIDDSILSAKYLFYYLKAISTQILTDAIGVAQPNISSKQIHSYILPLPPIEQQNEFTEKIETIEKQKELIKQSISETEMLFNSRMDYYFD